MDKNLTEMNNGSSDLFRNEELNAFLRRAFLFLEDEDWQNADQYCEKALDINPECGEAYLGKLMVALKVRHETDIQNASLDIEDSLIYQKILRFGDESLKLKISRYAQIIKANCEKKIRLFYRNFHSSIAVNEDGSEIVGLKSNGTVIGKPMYPINVEGYESEVAAGNPSRWSDIVSIAAGSSHIVGLKADGTVVAVGTNHAGPCNVGNWRNIIAVAAGYDYTVGLKADGTVVAVGAQSRYCQYGQCNVQEWSNIIAIAAGCCSTAALRADGTVFIVGRYNGTLEGWNDVTRIIISNECIIGLKFDGSIVCVCLGEGRYDYKHELSTWTDIVDISGSAWVDDHIAGVKADGTVVAIGNNKSGQCNVETWTDIVAVTAGGCCTVGLKPDGTVVSTKKCESADLKALLLPLAANSLDELMMAKRFRREAYVQEKQKKEIEFLRMYKNIFAKRQQTSIAAGSCAVAVKSDGSIISTGDKFPLYWGWKNIIYVAMSNESFSSLIYAVRVDGTVVTSATSLYRNPKVEGWKDIVAIAAAQDHVVGLKTDGTVVATLSDEKSRDGQCNVKGWRDIVAVAAACHYTVGLKNSGTVVTTEFGPDLNEWTDIFSIAAGYDHTVGLKSDGTVVAAGSNKKGQCNVGMWKDIVAVAAGYDHTVGLKSDGTVVAAGSNEKGQCNAEAWKDIVAVAAGYELTIGLKSDGTIVAVGSNEKGQCNVESWSDISLPLEAENYDELISKRRKLIETKIKEKKENELKQIKQRRESGLCSYCGGAFGGLFIKTCQKCGKKKDY